jgi:hypothetical protein
MTDAERLEEIRERHQKGVANVRLAAETQDGLERASCELHRQLPLIGRTAGPTVSVTFWYNTSQGPTRVSRQLVAPTWHEIQGNYGGSAGTALARLMSAREPQGGKMIVWTGPPGTGKTYAIRALAQAWRPWADLHYLIDSEQFFGDQAAALVHVLLADTEAGVVRSASEEPQPERYRLLILEDCGEMLSKDAKQHVGQALSRLLNLSDGLLGQGLNVLTLLTANEEIGSLSDAITRPGRCWQHLKFGPMTIAEQAAWYAAKGADATPRQGDLLADMYGHLNEWSNGRRPSRMGFGSEVDRAPSLVA